MLLYKVSKRAVTYCTLLYNVDKRIEIIQLALSLSLAHLLSTRGTGSTLTPRRCPVGVPGTLVNTHPGSAAAVGDLLNIHSRCVGVQSPAPVC